MTLAPVRGGVTLSEARERGHDPKARAHRRGLPYAEVPAALAAVEASGAGSVVKAAIRFTAPTAVRSGEARGATWGEVDLEARE